MYFLSDIVYTISLFMMIWKILVNPPVSTKNSGGFTGVNNVNKSMHSISLYLAKANYYLKNSGESTGFYKQNSGESTGVNNVNKEKVKKKTQKV